MLGLSFLSNGSGIDFNYNDGTSIAWTPGAASSTAQILKGWQRTAADAAHLNCIVLEAQNNSSQTINLPISPAGVQVPIAQFPCTIGQLIDGICAANSTTITADGYQTTTGATWQGTGSPTVKDALQSFQSFSQLYPDSQNNYWLG